MLKDENLNNLAGALKKDKQSNLNPALKNIQSGIYHAITVSNKRDGSPLVDPEGRGRIAAYVPKLGGNPDSPLYFQYASPFAGSNSQGSYGFHAVPPSGGITILVFFADNGELSEGYWFSVVQEVPDIAAGGASGLAKVDGTGQGEGAFKDQPSAKINHTELSKLHGADTSSIDVGVEPMQVATDVKDSGLTSKLDGKDGIIKVIDDGENPEDEVVTGRNQRNASNNIRSSSSRDQISDNHPRNINTATQGIYADGVRGQTTASPIRNASYKNPKPNSVYGLKTPGSTVLTMDDGSVDDDGFVHPNQIRLQTGSGASVILDGTNDLIYMINSTGSGWVEIGSGGEVMIYAQGSLSMRTEKDFNLRADQNINIEAADKINIKSGDDFQLNSGDQIHLKSEGSQFFDSGGSNHTKVGSNMYVSTGGLLHLNGPQAALSPGINTVSHSDIQNLESTKIEESILSTMVSHEPMIRKKPAPANTSSSSEESDTVNGGKIPATFEDSNSVATNDSTVDPDQQKVNDQEIAEQVGSGNGLVTYVSGFSGRTRNKPIQSQLFSILESAAQNAGVNVVIFSGGQDPAGPGARRTGSTRHDNGYAADVWLYSGPTSGSKLSSSKSSDIPIIKKFAKACFDNNANAVGVGPGYMDDVGVHVDIATYKSDSGVWGSTHSVGSASSWLIAARDESNWRA
ncbi:phage baseplate assembly protein V [bacterium]|nr:phage baseplate assembly protein V [bacterium]